MKIKKLKLTYAVAEVAVQPEKEGDKVVPMSVDEASEVRSILV